MPENGIVGTPLTITGKVRPAFASNTDIVWSVVDGGNTGANISGNILIATSSGTVTIRATVANGKAEGKAYTEDFEIIISNSAIGGGVALTITPPVKNGTPSTVASGDGNFTVGAVSWLPNDNPFKSDTAYTATVTLAANEGYAFPSGITATVNNNNADVTENTETSITVSYTFAKTLAKDITGLTIITQPKLAYTEGDQLDLSLLVVRLIFDSGSPEDVAYSNFDSYNITTSPLNGTALTLSHDGNHVAVSVGTHSQNTDNLTVNKRNASDVDFPTAAAITYGAALSSSTLSGGNTDRGTFAWQNPSTIPTVNNSGYLVEFTPNDTATYDYSGVEGWNSASNKVIRTVSITVNKAAGSAVSKPAVSGSPTSSSITVSAATLTNNATGQSIEYAISTSSSGNDLSYQDNTTFSGLTSGTTYYVYARSKSSTNYNAGTPNVSDGITTSIAVTLNSVTANGSSTQTTTQLTLTFSTAITGLAVGDIALSGVTGVSKGTLSNSGAVYTLTISGFTAGGTLSVAVEKSGYAISGSPQTVTIYYATAVTFSSVTANGSSTQTTTQLTLTFSTAITGLAVGDITLSGVTGVSKGTLSNSGAVYTLTISGFTDPKLIEAVNTWLKGITGYFEIGTEPVIVELSNGFSRNSFSRNGFNKSDKYRYATIAPIGSTNWSVVTLFDSSSLFSFTKLIPLFVLMCVLFIAFAFATSIISYRFLYKPAVDLSYSKDEFLARMSHEIRTPMNAITGMVELALREDMTNAAKEHILTVKQAGANLLSLINDILDFSKIESGRLEIIPTKYMLSSLINDTVNIIRMRLKEKPLRFFTNIDGNIPNNLYGDEIRLRQIILNLLTNSIKYSEKGQIGLIVTADKRNDKRIWLKISVTDTGKGIKPEDQKKLFEEFVQVDTQKNKGIEGTGLGLAITKHLCVAMGGNIKVESEYGKGSVFTTTIPQDIESQEPFAMVEDHDKKKVLIYERRLVYAKSICWALENMNVFYTLAMTVNEFTDALRKEEWSYVFSGYGIYKDIKSVIEQDDSAFYGKKKPPVALMIEWGTETHIPGVRFMSVPVNSLSIANVLNGREDNKGYHKSFGGVRFTAPRARILVVDDISTNLKVAEGLLAPYHVIVDTCLTGLQSIELVKQNEYDIIFMDHMMPGMDGIEATAAIRAWEREKNSPNSTEGEPQQTHTSFTEDKHGQTRTSFTEGETRSDNRNLLTQIPIVALTANAVAGMKEMFLENGFDDFLSKPIDVSKLEEMLDRLIPEGKKEKGYSTLQQTKETGEPQEADIIEMDISPILGVDIKKGIALTGGTLEIYKQVLAMFCKDLDERILFLQKEPNADTLHTFVTHVHSIKSASAVIGATEFSAIAAKLEAEGKAGNIAFINENIPDFLRRLDDLKKNILSALPANK
ncbi:ATP-binding protein [Treponema sp. R6D11]